MRQRLLWCAVLTALVISAPVYAEVKVALVDMQRAINDCDAGKKAKAQFRAKIMQVQGRLQKEQAEVQALKEELEKKGMLMRQDERQNLEDQYTHKLRAFEQEYKNTRDDLREKDVQMTGAIVRDLTHVVHTLGRQQGYTLVVEKASILYAVPAVDITDQVIRSYNAMHVKPGTLGASSETPRLGNRGLGASPLSIAPAGTGGRSTISR